ncbi:MAG: hypothetical protein IJT37_10070 [Lachnospiraceae bacterium]|nr:hypothetical protein [Lachnospiraceae bacterium]
MFDTFGEFDSWEEINKAAQGQKEEGDEEALIKLAEENGIDREDAEDYYDGAIQELCTSVIAALGKLKVEKEEYKKSNKEKNIIDDWISYIENLVSTDEAYALNIRRKGRNLKGCIGALLKYSFEHQVSVDKDIIKEAKINAGKVTMGIPNMQQAHKIIKEYYGG